MWFKIANVAELKNSSFIYKKAGNTHVVIGKLGPKIFAFDSRCPHKGGPLQDGTIIGRRIKCPWHGYEYDIFTGKPTLIPYPPEYGNWRKTGNLIIYDVKVRSKIVFVNIQ